MGSLSNSSVSALKRSSALPAVVLAPRKEVQQTSTALQQITLFPYASVFQRPQIVAATLTFRLQSVGFRKSQALPFFLALELLAGQKPIATLAKRNVPVWKVRKGRLVGGRVTVRSGSLGNLLTRTSRRLPRVDSLVVPSFTARVEAILRARQSEERQRILRHNASRRAGENQLLRRRASHQLPPAEARTLTELSLYAPFSRALGLHPDVRSLGLTVHLSARTLEERYFLLRAAGLARA